VSGLVRGGLDERYFRAWRSNANPLLRLDRARAVRRFEAAVNRFGYSLVELERSLPGEALPGGSTQGAPPGVP
jgi:hypothetical protein